MFSKLLCAVFHHRWGDEITHRQGRVVYTEQHCLRCPKIRYSLPRWVEE